MDKYIVLSTKGTANMNILINEHARQGYRIDRIQPWGSGQDFILCVMELPDELYSPDPTTDKHSAFDEGVDN